MNDNPQIACVIVTYNRKELLKRCLDAVYSQTYKPKTVYITDNASTDGTIDSVKEWGYYECERDGITFKYILNSKNEGGAGGFYLGMKTAYETGTYDAIWLMDDDGIPDKNCLMHLQSYLPTYDYIAPLVISQEDNKKLAFSCRKTVDKEGAIKKYSRNGLIFNYASPFNGILFSYNLIKKLGYPQKEMFIWGDEFNYHIRCIQHGFSPVTVINAIHIHPADRQIKACSILGGGILVVDKKWKWFCLSRNKCYNYVVKYGRLLGIIFILHFYIRYSLYYLKKKNWAYISILNIAIYKGFIGDFNGLDKYFND